MQLLAQIAAFRSRLTQYRVPFLMIGFGFFIVGLWWSFGVTNIALSQLNYAVLPIAVLAVVCAVLVNALEQWFAARALKVDYSYPRALTVSSGATLANLLPVPGGLLVRGVSFTNAGAKKGEAAYILAAGAAIWVLLSLALVLFAVSPSARMGAVAAGLVLIALAITIWLARRFDFANTVGMVATRLALIALTVIRLFALLSVISVDMPLREAAIYSGASIAGQVVGIIPSGIGLVEGVGAALALLIDANPGAAFIALSLNRFFGLVIAGAIVLVATIMSGSKNGIIGKV